MQDVKGVSYLKDYQLEVIFEDNARGVVDLKDYPKRGGVFSRFSDMAYFQQVHVNRDIGTLCWPGDVDIAPETLYRMAVQSGMKRP